MPILLFDESSPSRRSELIREVIHDAAEQVGFDPCDWARVLDLAAIGITRLAWRDSPVEDWHAHPHSRISDPELMRATVAVTRLVRDLLNRHMAGGPHPRQQTYVDVDAGVVFGAVGRSLKDHDRQLPDGRILRDLAPDHAALETFDDHVDILTGRWIALNDQIGGGTALFLLAVLGAARCRRWWRGPDWPYLVAEFIARVNDPTRWEDPVMAAHLSRLDWPQQCADADALDRLLLRGPDLLDIDTARYCLRAGLGFLLP